LEDATGIDRRALAEFRPGMSGAQEKLQWTLMRVTTLPEDAAHSLFGIFGVHPSGQHHVVCSTSILLRSLSDDEMETVICSLRDAQAVKAVSQLYATLDRLSAPRLHTADCIYLTSYLLLQKSRRVPAESEEHPLVCSQGEWSLRPMISTSDKLVSFSSTMHIRQKLLLVRPWDRGLFDLDGSRESSYLAVDS